MTHASVETSVEGQEPLELYEFVSIDKTYTYCTGEDEVVWNGRTYVPTYLDRGDIPHIGGSDPDSSSLNLTLPDNLEVVELWRTASLSQVVDLTIYRWHRTELQAEFSAVWTGRVSNISWQSGRSVNINSQSPFTSVLRIGLKRKIQINCPHSLYGSLCTVVKETFAENYTVDSVSGATVTISAIAGGGFDATYFSGGYMVWLNPSLIAPSTERGFIFTQTGNDLELTTVPFALAAGTLVTVYPGCPRTMDACDTRFSNLDNYGGFPWRPGNNIFSGIGAIAG